MDIREYLPCPKLLPYIDAYWEATSDNSGDKMEKIIPDGCVDLLINLGERFYIPAAGVWLENGKTYLGGTITRAVFAELPAGMHLQGIRFKPAAFPYFYAYDSLHITTNRFVDFDAAAMPGMAVMAGELPAACNRLLANRFTTPAHSLLPLMDTIRQHKGNMTVQQLAALHYMTVRQLERGFRTYAGLSPKELISIIRYQYAAQLISTAYPHRSLLDIALESGYYDHAHLSNEIKKYAGVAPTRL
ncbi:helix-turn-helix transcriptional regulator [Chitinophaga nivalis]|uniref:Helix-turn-helix transcriptional regulator n=1 Tax=Chitinophaga nivalis TaxID=2991709 RepID=A0ABT3IGV0_9BACT|nr:helix-turn-helix transcriptional regulator [Chitinophaga nivalis]MCW3467314.1 helix-turn-helix transcriptional regulator [Chitinophaga nivalis]MCW3482994.1 helix-turn-helix transcriptional regulator [Chitinophaga nivalis]